MDLQLTLAEAINKEKLKKFQAKARAMEKPKASKCKGCLMTFYYNDTMLATEKCSRDQCHTCTVTFAIANLPMRCECESQFYHRCCFLFQAMTQLKCTMP